MKSFFNFLKREKNDGAMKLASDYNAVNSGGVYCSNVAAVNSPTSALSVAAFHRAVEVRANTMSQLVMEYQKLNDKSHGSNYEADTRAYAKRLNYLLQVMPNPTMTAEQFFKQIEILKIFCGNVVVYIERDSEGEISALWLCSNASLIPTDFTYNITYNSTKGIVNKGNIPACDVLHFRNTFSNDCGLTGIPTLIYARAALSLAATNDKLVTDTAAKGMRQKLIVQEEKAKDFGIGRANKKELEKVTKNLQDDIIDKDVILLSNIASVTPISTNLQQQEINQIRSFSVREIARFMGVPAILLMDDSNSSYKSPEAATQEFLLRTIQPSARAIEIEMNAKILGPEGYPQHRFHFNDDYLMRLDPISRANINKTLIETGVKCVNELRSSYDLPAVVGGDKHFISTNLQQLDAPVVKIEQNEEDDL